MVKHVVLSVVATAGVMTVLFLTVFHPESPAPYSSADGHTLRFQYLEDRLDSLESLLAGIRERPPLYADAGPSEAEDEQPQENEPNFMNELAGLRSTLKDLGYRVQTLEEDPINRGYAFLSSESPELRREGINTLRRLARFDPVAREALRRMLADPNAGVRRQAIDALGDLGDKEAVPLLADLLADGDAEVRRESVQNLGKLGAKEAGLAIAELLADPSERVRQEAADVLGRLGSKEAAAALIGVLGDENEDVRGEAIASLGELGAREAVAALRGLYDGEPGRHRVRLIRALKQLGDNEPFQSEVRRLSQSALSGEDPRERGRAIQMLGWFARDEAREVFLRLREDPNEWVRSAAERALRGEGGRGGPRR